MAKLGIFEILEKACKESKVDDRAKVLRENAHPVLHQVLKYTFDSRVEFDLPAGAPPFSEADPVNAETFLYQQGRKLQLLRKGGTGDQLTPTKREFIFIELLEMIHARDAWIIIGMKDKKLPDDYSKITKNVVDKAFPGLLDQPI